jgi:hypothetical protein
VASEKQKPPNAVASGVRGSGKWLVASDEQPKAEMASGKQAKSRRQKAEKLEPEVRSQELEVTIRQLIF